LKEKWYLQIIGFRYVQIKKRDATARMGENGNEDMWNKWERYTGEGREYKGVKATEEGKKDQGLRHKRNQSLVNIKKLLHQHLNIFQ
jgi:hypothetical protein